MIGQSCSPPAPIRRSGRSIPFPIATPSGHSESTSTTRSCRKWVLCSSIATNRLIGSSRYYGHDPERSEIEIGWTFIVRSHWGGPTNREVKRLMLDHAFKFVDTVIFWVGEKNWRSQGAMTKIGGVKRDGLFTRELSGTMPYFIFEITKSRYQQGGRALVA
jgi:RimJ/RimL family protein N-acetyltransferase